MLEGDVGSFTLPFDLDHFGVAWTKRSTWSRQGTRVFVHISMDVEQQSDHNQVTPFGMEPWDCGAESNHF